MDLWVVAAAAGAGYIAKNLQNFSDDKKESPSLKYSYPESRNFLQQLRDKTCPLRRLARKRVQDDNFLDLDDDSGVKFSEIDRSSSRDREASVVSVNDDHSEKTGILEDYNKGWISGLAAEVGVGENQQFGDGENRNLSRVNGGKMARSRGSRVHSTNMEHSSCLYNSTSMLATGVMWGENSSFSQLDGCSEDHKTLSSSSSLKRFESSEELRKLERSSSNSHQSGSRDGVRGRSSRSQGAETVLLFITGMTVGIFTATTSWKNEVDELSSQLKQMQNLVHDLHEELDMKEMLKVKELDIDGEDTPLSTEEPVSSPSLVKAGKMGKTNGVKANDKNTENLELLSRIEAELQAELEMLEQNMKESELERISCVVEIDPDFEPETVRGELKPAMVENASESTRETIDDSEPVNYAVSPWELSLRLHELIESRMEAHIKELEMALSHSENRVGDYGRRFSCSETESSSTNHSPTCICDELDKGEDEPSNGGGSGSNIVDRTRSSSKIQNGDYYGSISRHGGEDRSPNEDSMSEDESEMLLIKQIIERRRSGSSFDFKFIEM